jgi:hypothetical protein
MQAVNVVSELTGMMRHHIRRSPVFDSESAAILVAKLAGIR